MPVYPVVNTKTGERKEVEMSIFEWDQWKTDNPEWTRDWSDPKTCPASTELGEWKDKLAKKHPGWNEVLDSASRVKGSQVKKI